MRTSLNEIRQTELYLQGGMDTGDALVFEARLLTDPVLSTNMHYQKMVYKVLSLFNRKAIKYEIATVEDRLFTNPEYGAFQRHIHSLFKQ